MIDILPDNVLLKIITILAKEPLPFALYNMKRASRRLYNAVTKNHDAIMDIIESRRATLEDQVKSIYSAMVNDILVSFGIRNPGNGIISAFILEIASRVHPSYLIEFNPETSISLEYEGPTVNWPWIEYSFEIQMVDPWDGRKFGLTKACVVLPSASNHRILYTVTDSYGALRLECIDLRRVEQPNDDDDQWEDVLDDDQWEDVLEEDLFEDGLMDQLDYERFIFNGQKSTLCVWDNNIAVTVEQRFDYINPLADIMLDMFLNQEHIFEWLSLIDRGARVLRTRRRYYGQ